MSIPLVQNNDKDSINTSIIAIKRNIERINMLLGLVDNDSPDLSGFATKQELQDAVTDLQPVDEVTSGNMQSVTSNAVAEAFLRNVYNSGNGEINKTGGNFRTISNVPKGVYLAIYGFGYVAGGAGYWKFTTTDPQGVTYSSLMSARTEWLGSFTTIIYLPNGGNVSFSAYSADSRINEQGNGKGLTLVKIGDV